MVEKNEKGTVAVPPATAEQVVALRDWFIGNMSEGLQELEVKFNQSDLWAGIYTSIAKPVWDDGFDKGEQDVWAHEEWDEPCIPNPWAETTPYTPHNPASTPFQGN